MKLTIICFALLVLQVYSTPVLGQKQDNVFIGGMFAINQGSNLGNVDRESAFFMAIDEINENNSLLPNINLVGITVDSESNPQIASSRLQDLVNQDIIALVGPSLSSVAERIAMHSTLPMVSPSATSLVLSDKADYPSFVRLTSSNRFQSVALLDIVVYFDWPLISIIASNDSYSVGNISPIIESKSGTSVGVDTFLDRAQELEIVIDKTIIIKRGESDIESQLKSIRDSKSKIILINLVARDAVPVLEMAGSLGLTSQNGYVWIASDGVMQSEIINSNSQVRNTSQGMIGLNPAIPDGFRLSNFLDVWENCRGYTIIQYPGCGDRSPNVYSPFTYDSVYFIALALEHMISKGRDISNSDELLNSLYNVKFEGVTGIIKIDQFGDRTGSYSLMNVRGNTMHKVGEWNLETGLELHDKIIWNGDVDHPQTDLPRGVKGLLIFGNTTFYTFIAIAIMMRYMGRKSPRSIRSRED